MALPIGVNSTSGLFQVFIEVKMTFANAIVVATRNGHKVHEMQAIAGSSVRLMSLGDFPTGGSVQWVEDGDSFAANAAIKARAVWNVLKQPTLADDSGLCVEALSGAPGIHSARYAGEGASDQDNNTKLLQNLAGIEDRRAKFHCTLCYIDERGNEHFFTGECHGELLQQLAGHGGFGYDPLFLPRGERATFAELKDEQKNKISHRGIALRNFLTWYQVQRGIE
jgi:XTP/dITP diphosphohydrolase